MGFVRSSSLIAHLYFHMASDGEVVRDDERNQLEPSEPNKMYWQIIITSPVVDGLKVSW